jgi:hypothetical protein
MTRAEKLLYHQVHPFKLLTDVSTSFASSSLLWQGRWLPAAIVALLPSIVVSAWLVAQADLTRYARTPLGRYVAKYMTRKMEVVRLSGQVVMWIGAAAHVPWLLPLGFMLVVFGWSSALWATTPDEGCDRPANSAV